jgi:hypothetical protein
MEQGRYGTKHNGSIKGATHESRTHGQAIAWLQPGQKPAAQLAVFWCKVACALEDGLDQYHYHDKGLTPPKRTSL